MSPGARRRLRLLLTRVGALVLGAVALAGCRTDVTVSVSQRLDGAGRVTIRAVLDRDYNRMLDLGGNIYFLAKLFSTDGLSFLQAVSTMSGMSLADYSAMMIAGGRSPDGQRSIRDKT